MKKGLAVLAGFLSALVAGTQLQGCGCTDLPETVHVGAGTYVFAGAAPAGYSGYSLVVTADSSGAPTSAVEFFTLSGVPHVYTYQFRNLGHTYLAH